MAEASPAVVLTRAEYNRLLKILAFIEPKIRGGWEDEAPDWHDQETKTIRITGPAVGIHVGDDVGEELDTDEGEPLEIDEGTSLEIDPPAVAFEYLYPGEFVWRDMSTEALGTDAEWKSYHILCWAYDVQARDLQESGLYQGRIEGMWKQDDDFRSLVEVQAAGGSVQIIQVTGRPRVVSGRRWYPGTILDHDPLTQLTSPSGADVWLLQCVNGELATSGSGNYLSIDRGYSFEVCSEGRRVYETDEMRRMIQGACDAVTGQWKAVFEGPFEGDLTDPCEGTTTTSTTSTTTTTTTTAP